MDWGQVLWKPWSFFVPWNTSSFYFYVCRLLGHSFVTLWAHSIVLLIWLQFWPHQVIGLTITHPWNGGNSWLPSNLGRGCLILDGFSSHIFIFSLAQALKLFLFLIPYNSVQFSYFLCLHDIIFFDLQKDDCLVYFSHQLCFIILVQFHLVFCFL